MARLKLDLPDTFIFSTEIPLRIGDINYGGHLGNDAVLSLVHEARVLFLNSHGFTELDVDGVGIIMNDAAIVFRSEAFYGETIVVDIAAADVTRVGCDLLFRLTEKTDGREVARAKTGFVFFDYESRKVKPIPDLFRQIIEA